MNSDRIDYDPIVVRIVGTNDIQDYDKEYAQYLIQKEQLQALRDFSKSLVKTRTKQTSM